MDLARLERAPTTVARARAVLDPFIGWARDRQRHEPGVDALTRSTLEAYDAEQVAAGNGVATRRTAMWALGSCWRWGWAHPEWRPHLAEPNVPKMPRVKRKAPTAATWAQLDAIVHLATEAAAKSPADEWVRRLVLIMRATGWRVTQSLAIEWPDVDLEAGTLRCRVGKGDRETEEERVVPLAPWIVAEIKTWAPRKGRLVGAVKATRKAALRVGGLWRASGAPSEVYVQRPDHAFRIGLLSGLAALRCDREAAEYYVGHALTGLRGVYVDPSALPVGEVARLIPPVGPRVRDVSAGQVVRLDQRPSKRARG